MQINEHPLLGWGGSHYSPKSFLNTLSPHTAVIFLQVDEHLVPGGSHYYPTLTTLSPHFQQTEGD